MDIGEINEGLRAFGQEVVDSLPRHPTKGYKGKIKRVKRVIAIVIVECEDGQDRPIDPAELLDENPDVAVRDWITVRGDTAGGRESVKPGGSGGLDVGNLIGVLSKGTPAGGVLGTLRGLLGGK